MDLKKSLLLLLILQLLSCTGKQKKEHDILLDFPEIKATGEITVVTSNSSTSYFMYKMQSMGYEYDLIADFARTHRLTLKVKTAENSAKMIEMLQAGEADVVAFPVAMQASLKQTLIFCGHEEQSNLVLVQRANRGDTLLRDVTELIGKEIYVNSHTRYDERLQNLNKELGGGIKIKYMDQDSVTTEDLIEKVARGVIPYTISNNDVARLNRTYFRNLNINLQISFNQRTCWVVRKNSPLLSEAINEWASNNKGKRSYQSAIKRYFERSKIAPSEEGMPIVRDGQISPYDTLFRKYAPRLGWDWQLLASISYQESHFLPSIIAWSGAEGIMGIMPTTARYLGFEPGDMQDPEKCLQAGIECLLQFGKGFESIPDSIERVRFTLASYNAGIGHIYDAQRLAKKYGKDPTKWDQHVADFVLLKREPRYYTDSVVKHGYLRGKETFNYVNEVMNRYHYFKKKTTATESADAINPEKKNQDFT